MTQLYDAYFEAVTDACGQLAADILLEARDAGVGTARLLRELVARGQQEVGRLWADGLMSIADAHSATGIAEQVAAALVPFTRSKNAEHRVVMACPEGEWHTLPLRLAAAIAATPAVDLIVVPGSLPARDLRRFLRSAEASAVALSVTTPTALLAAARSVEAAHAEGLPVVVGGGAWGAGQHRAHRLGADLWLEDGADLASVLPALATNGPLVVDRHVPPVAVESLLLDRAASSLVKPSLERFTIATAWGRSISASDRDQGLGMFRLLARHTGAAVATDDPTIVRDALCWLVDLSEARGHPPEGVTDAAKFLADGLRQVAPLGSEMLRREAEWARAGSRRTDRDPTASPVGTA